MTEHTESNSDSEYAIGFVHAYATRNHESCTRVSPGKPGSVWRIDIRIPHKVPIKNTQLGSKSAISDGLCQTFDGLTVVFYILKIEGGEIHFFFNSLVVLLHFQVIYPWISISLNLIFHSASHIFVRVFMRVWACLLSLVFIFHIFYFECGYCWSALSLTHIVNLPFRYFVHHLLSYVIVMYDLTSLRCYMYASFTCFLWYFRTFSSVYMYHIVFMYVFVIHWGKLILNEVFSVHLALWNAWVIAR